MIIAQKMRVVKWSFLLLTICLLVSSIWVKETRVVYNNASVDAVGTISTGKSHQGIGYEASITFTEGVRKGWYKTVPISLGDYAHYKVGDIILVRDNEERDRLGWLLFIGFIAWAVVTFLIWFVVQTIRNEIE